MIRTGLDLLVQYECCLREEIMNIVFKSSHRSKELDDPLTIEAIFCPTVRGRSPEEGGTVWRRSVETVDPYLPK